MQKDGWRFRYRLRLSMHFSALSIDSNLIRGHEDYAKVFGRSYAQNKAVTAKPDKDLMNECNSHELKITYEGRSLTWRVNVLTLTTPPKSFVRA